MPFLNLCARSFLLCSTALAALSVSFPVSAQSLRGHPATRASNDAAASDAQVSAAFALAGRADTLPEGIARLERLAERKETRESATQALRAVLLRAPARDSVAAPLSRYVARHPDDRDLAFRYRLATNAAYAEQAYRRILAERPRDADALGGLGLLALDKGQTQEARGFFARAIAADPSRLGVWQAAMLGATHPPSDPVPEQTTPTPAATAPAASAYRSVPSTSDNAVPFPDAGVPAPYRTEGSEPLPVSVTSVPAAQIPQSMQTYASILRRDPRDSEARKNLVQALLASRNLAEADRLAREGVALAPNDPKTWMAQSYVDVARGDNPHALEAMERAQDLRAQQVGGSDYGAGQPPVEGATVTLAPDAPPVYTDSPPSGNNNETPLPAARGGVQRVQSPAPKPPYPLNAGSSPFGTSVLSDAQNDPLTVEINQSISALRHDTAPSFQAGVTFRDRSGTAGLDRLMEVATPVEGTYSPGGNGQLKITAQPTYLSAGTLAPGSQSRFGSQALAVTPSSAPVSGGATSATGVGLDLAYQYGWLSADIGSTPLGFDESSVIGGVQLSPHLSDNLTLKVTGERRAVTDSLLSYAGQKDPRTGQDFGGVTRSRGYAQLDYRIGKVDLYAGAGYSVLGGARVASNTEAEANIGGSYSLWHTPRQDLRLGLDVSYLGFAKNLSGFTTGQGGYFSPQSYAAVMVPVTYAATPGDGWSYKVNAAVGYQSYRQSSSPYYPANASLQSALEAQAANIPGMQVSYPKKGSSGIAGNIGGSLEYSVSSNVKLGVRVNLQHAGDYSEASGMLYGRYVFGPATGE